MNLQRLSIALTLDEGNKSKPYVDTVGKTTIGVGRNLTDRGVSPDEISLMLANDIKLATNGARNLFPAFTSLDDVRQEVLVNMAFNMGQSKLSVFVKFIAAVNARSWSVASAEMLNSRWATQVGDRAKRLAYAMANGVFQ